RGPAEVVQRAVTAAEPPLRAARDGPEDVRLRGLDRVRYVEPAGQPGRGGRGEAAPGAVVVRGVDARRPQLARPGAVEDHVHRVVAGVLHGVAALHHHNGRAERAERAGRLVLVRQGTD